MTLGEKSAAVTGGESSNQRFAPELIKTAGRNEAGAYTFSDVVDKACEGLMNRQIKFSIRRIKEMEKRLCDLEQELDTFLESRVNF